MSVTSVARDRWLKAQEWELSEWEAGCEKTGWRRLAWRIARPVLTRIAPHRYEGSDWNIWWAEQFENYAFLPKAMDNYLELGCGPFTNTRIVLKDRSAKHIFCSDPLVRQYTKFKGRWLAKNYATASIMIDDHPIEECPFASNYFDCVVMTNVLDHVFDSNLCVQAAARVVKPGGVLIIGQDLSDAKDLEREPDHIGHPIRLAADDVERHLGDFTPVIRKELARDEGREPHAHCGTLIYAGRKNAPSPQ